MAPWDLILLGGEFRVSGAAVIFSPQKRAPGRCFHGGDKKPGFRKILLLAHFSAIIHGKDELFLIESELLCESKQ
jgi:membrane-associated PAP2 superfamily phosphatase